MNSKSARHSKVVVLLVPVLILLVVGTGLLWLESNRAKMAPSDEAVEAVGAKIEVVEGTTTDCWTLFYNSARWHAIAALSANDIWAVGSYWPTDHTTPRALTAHWDGNKWNMIPTPDTEANQPDSDSGLLLRAVDAVSTNDVWVVGSSSLTGTGMFDAGQRTLIMHWDGKEWSAIPHPVVTGGYLTDVSVASPDDVWVVGTELSGPKLEVRSSIIMHWDGTAWSRIQSGDLDDYGLGPFNNVVAISRNNVWAVGVGIIHWDGQSWSQYSIPGFPDPSSFGELVGLAAIGPDDIWAVGADSKQGELVTAHWDGKAWIGVPTVDIGYTASAGIAAFSTNDVWVVGGNSVIRWDGKSWTPMHSPSVTGDVKFEAATVIEDYLWAVGAQIVRYKAGCAGITPVEKLTKAIP